MMLPRGRCATVTRHGVKESASILSRLALSEMSCCGSRSLATVTNGESCSGHSTVTSSTGVWARSTQSCLDIEFVGAVSQLGDQREAIHLRRRGQIELALHHVVGERGDRSKT